MAEVWPAGGEVTAAVLALVGGYGHVVNSARSGRPCMTPRLDPKIPPLVSVTEAARRLGCSKNWVSRLLDAGHLVGQEVGRNTVVAAAQVDALAQARSHGQDGWRAPGGTPPIPPLVSTSEFAELVGLAQGNWPRELFLRGQVPGTQVGRNVLFRRAVADRFAVLRQLGHTAYPDEADMVPPAE
ncbi:helix-turn-helix domain-containing protein [Solihabitans fulvus]|uniref:Helix-turn-helix domain-containing protein n=1 Tax=Solihabitans fulvus TaxID=1892852 RepID=A0A5B2W9H0_9PSEU|nr:helix-turn-helix domain-containing protein [Solihabitans fulvus]KAA2247186.1 helix-turn-helix domain-containing protein [Solihabitans fulvus]